jgi:hypothetical protein
MPKDEDTAGGNVIQVMGYCSVLRDTWAHVYLMQAPNFEATPSFVALGTSSRLSVRSHVT